MKTGISIRFTLGGLPYGILRAGVKKSNPTADGVTLRRAVNARVADVLNAVVRSLLWAVTARDACRCC
jgi:hypothetical protein